MNNFNQDQVVELLLKKIKDSSQQEQVIIHHILQREHITRNINKDFDSHLTFGQRVADRVATFGGSWTFIFIFLGVLVTWIAVNSVILMFSKNTFDPYPYILLNLLLSMTAALQAPVIMMSQNRHSEKDRMDAAHDYEVNLKAELEIAALHEKIDLLREKQWTDLVAMQQEQINLLQKLLEENKRT